MIVQSEDGQYASVYVPDGESFTLHRQNHSQLDVTTQMLRPRSTLALLALVGQPTVGTARLSDRNAFDVLERTDEMLLLSQVGDSDDMAGRPTSYWKGVVSLLDEESPRPPPSLRLFVPKSAAARTKGCGCQGTRSLLNTLPVELAAGIKETTSGTIAVRDKAEVKPLMPFLNATHQYREIAVPDVLQKLNIFTFTVALGDIVVGKRATLTLGEDIFLATAGNVLLYQAARVRSGSSLMLDVQGRMRGNLVNLVHRFSDKLMVDHNALSQLSASGN